MHDFAVVGMGPPGAHFAKQAAARGFDVVGFERGEVGQPLACSGHVSLDIWEYLPDDAPSALRQNQIRGARFRIGGPDARAYPFYRERPVSNVINRVELDRRLAELAAEAGASVQAEHSVAWITEEPDRVKIGVTGPDGTETVEARMVIGADGAQSTVRRELALPEPNEFLRGVLVHTDNADEGDFVDVHLTVPTFFGWRIPRGAAGVEYGLAAPPDVDVTGELNELLDGYGADPESRFAGAIPIGPPDRTTSDRALLLGDAAGQTKPFTGGGILYGLQAADIAADTVDPRDPGTLQEYERGWRDALGTEIRLGSLLRRAYSLPSPIQRAGLWLLSGEIGVHMDKPSSFFSRDQLRALFR
ncbi:MAG: geranylgeranyl reductase family protein [Halodesulfurarchaeum sp.]